MGQVQSCLWAFAFAISSAWDAFLHHLCMAGSFASFKSYLNSLFLSSSSLTTNPMLPSLVMLNSLLYYFNRVKCTHFLVLCLIIAWDDAHRELYLVFIVLADSHFCPCSMCSLECGLLLKELYLWECWDAWVGRISLQRGCDFVSTLKLIPT